MAIIWADRVLETSTTTGTGALTLAGAITGFQAFSAVMTSPSDTCYYSIWAVDAGGTPTGEWETGLGTYSASNTLTRTTVLDSSNSGSAVNFSAGTKRVTLSQVAQNILSADLTAYLEKAGGTMTGALTTATAASGQESLIVPHGAAPTSPTNGSVWTTSSGTFVRINGVTYQLASLAKAETLTNKTIVDPVLTGTPTTDIYTISDGGSVTIDPADGEVQIWTLGANRTPTLTSITAGKAVLLLINDGTAYTLTLSGVIWLNNGLSAPSLKATGYTPILLFNVGGTVYGWLAGDGG